MGIGRKDKAGLQNSGITWFPAAPVSGIQVSGIQVLIMRILTAWGLATWTLVRNAVLFLRRYICFPIKKSVVARSRNMVESVAQCGRDIISGIFAKEHSIVDRTGVCNRNRTKNKSTCREHERYRRFEEGSGTMLGAMMVAVAAVLLSVIAIVGRVLICQTQVRGVADSAALSAATTLRDGGADPCATAQQVVSNNDAQLESCQVIDEDVQVDVGLSTGIPLIADVNAMSRAGPVPCE